MRRLSRLSALLVALAAMPTTLFAQGGGTITGRVTGADTGQPISAATVTVEGTSLRAVTDGQGRYTIRSVPAGNYTVSATTLGREAGKRQVSVAAGQTATVDFTLASRAIQLEGLVATATGEEQRAREVGNSIGRIDVAEDVPLAAVNDVSQVLQGRTAGVSVLQASGTAGTGARIRIRGSASVSLANDPLVIIDGVRTESGNLATLGTGGQTSSRLTDLNPEEIESVEVLKGPSASALYGTAAANGVVVITTKKGRAGRTTFHVYTEMGSVEDVTDYPGNFQGFCSYAPNPAVPSTRANVTFCDVGTYGDPEGAGLTAAQAATFRLDSIIGFNPLEDSRSTPFETGSRSKFGLSASGGSERVTFFLSADQELEGGVYKFGQNDYDRKSLRTNLRAELSSKLDVTVSAGYINSENILPQNDNNALGLIGGAMLSGAIRYDSISAGYGFGITPRQIALVSSKYQNERLIGSVDTRWRPVNWLSITGQAGIDHNSRFDVQNVPANQVPYNATYLQGFRDTYRTGSANYTANLNGTANFNLRENLTSTTSAGVQYSEEIGRRIDAFGAVLLAGVESLEGSNARYAVGEVNFQVRTIGAYVQQQFGLNDRLFVAAAVRADDNSAFGNDFGLVYYPSASISWVVAEEPWFPQASFLNTLRLRAAYGSSGLRPGQLDAFRYLDPVAVTTSASGGSIPGFTLGGAGNPALRPEKSTEFELGFDAGFFNDRVGLEFTWFDKDSKDALINVPLAPSLGVSAARRENLGSVENRGIEMLLRSRIVESDRFRWDATVTYSRLHNELTDLGDRPNPIIFGLGGNTQRHTLGRPLGAYFALPYTFEDADANGLITSDELTFTSDTAVFAGSWMPSTEASFQTNFEIGKIFRVSGLLDYRGGHKQFNSTREFKCGSRFNCIEIYDANTPLEDQAAAIATAYFDSPWGYFEDADFVKLREVAVTIGLPERLAQRFGSQGVSLTFSGRNLKTWTDYKGLDPEINYAGSGSNFNTAEFLTQPPARYFTARLDVTF